MLTKRIITDIAGTAPYLIRWSLWLPFGLSLKLHQIVRHDDDRCKHDHPWWFLRIILWGGYEEEFRNSKRNPPGSAHGYNRTALRKPWRPWAPWRIYYCGLDFEHRITRLLAGPSWSLVLCGPRFREWGFFTRQGWMQWRSFVDESRSKRVLWCDDDRVLNDDAEF
jgi:hypothetical protein